jgi:hypothetical protein
MTYFARMEKTKKLCVKFPVSHGPVAVHAGGKENLPGQTQLVLRQLLL